MKATEKIKELQKYLARNWLIHRDGFHGQVRAATFEDRGSVVTLFVFARNEDIEAQLIVEGVVIELNDTILEALDRVNVLRRAE